MGVGQSAKNGHFGVKSRISAISDPKIGVFGHFGVLGPKLGVKWGILRGRVYFSRNMVRKLPALILGKNHGHTLKIRYCRVRIGCFSGWIWCEMTILESKIGVFNNFNTFEIRFSIYDFYDKFLIWMLILVFSASFEGVFRVSLRNRWFSGFFEKKRNPPPAKWWR